VQYKVNNVSFPNLTVKDTNPFMAHDHSETLDNGVGFCAEVAPWIAGFVS